MATPTASALTLAPALIERLSSHVTSASGGTTTIPAPFTGEPLATVPVSNADDVRAAYERAREAQRAWERLPVRERVKPFLRMVDVLVDRREEILDVIQMETGKARRHAYEEFLDVALCTLYYARRAPRLLKPRRRQGAFPVATRTVELRKPKGVVGLISPWNYPFSLGASDIAPALMAGNAVIHKPDTQTCLSSLWVLDLLISLGLPRDLWQIVVGDPAEIGQALVDGADHVCFTGGNVAGRQVAEAAARRMIGATVQLGGKNPMLVLADADLDKAVPAAARAAFVSGGQMCLCSERIYVHESLYRSFVDRLAAHARSLRLGAGFHFDNDLGSLSNRRQFDKTAGHVEDAVRNGAVVEAGGRARPDLGPYFYEPTVLTGVTPACAVFTEETFGPVVSVYPFADEREALRLANATEYGLNASIWSRDLDRARELAGRIRSGAVNINEGYVSTHISYDAPMGGRKASGLGRRHGELGLLSLCDTQIVASQHGISFDPKPGVSHERQARQVSAIYRLLKALRLK